MTQDIERAQLRKDKGEEWVIVFFSEKGFCGNFNPQLLPLLNQHKKIKNVIVMGNRGKVYAERLGLRQAHFFSGAKRSPSEDLTEGAFNILKAHGFPHNVKVVFNKYNNMFQQVPRVVDFFPKQEDVFSGRGTLIDIDEEYLAGTILENYVKARLFFFISQTFTGEIASKLLMMQNATDSAEKLQNEISREVSKERQSRITQELSEVISAYKVLQSQNERR